MKLFWWEMRKAMRGGLALMILAAAAVVQIAVCLLPRVYDDPYIPEVYSAYTAQFAGAYTPETDAALRARAEEIASLLGEYDQMQSAYLSGALTLDGWNSYLEAYHAAKAEQSTVGYLVQKCDQWQLATDYAPEVFDDTDCLHRLSREGFDLIALCCVLWLTVPFFGQRAGEAELLRTMRHGRLRLCLARLMLAALCGFGVSLLLFAVRNFCLPMQNGGAALQNLLFYTGYGSTTVSQYLLQNALWHAAEWAVAAVGICAVTTLCKSPAAAIFLAAFALVVPAYTADSAYLLFCGSALRTLYPPALSWLAVCAVSMAKLPVYGCIAVRAWNRR